MSHLSKLFHWGPLLGISILMCVILTTIHFFVQMYFPLGDQQSLVMFILSIILTTLMIHCYICAILEHPGFAPTGWHPEKIEDEKYLDYCERCQSFKPPRSHHCSRCGRCVLKMDHHCYWVNGCIGYRNQKCFFYTVFLSVIGSIYSFAILYNAMHRVVYSIANPTTNQHIFLSLKGLCLVLFAMAMDLVGVFGFGPLLYVQVKGLMRNQTPIEELIVCKANRLERNIPFVFPYNLGIWNNVRQVLFESLQDGITWTVLGTCDQYTLTTEQLQHKKILMQNATRYRATSPFNGHCFPLFSQGLKVCASFPWNLKTRLMLKVNDDILVMQSTKQWLFGMKINSESGEQGWFPSKCERLVEMDEDTIDHATKQEFNEDEEMHSDSSEFSIGEFIDNLAVHPESKKDN